MIIPEFPGDAMDLIAGFIKRGFHDLDSRLDGDSGLNKSAEQNLWS